LLRVKDADELVRIAERVRLFVGSRPMQLSSGPLRVSLSLGSTLVADSEQIDDALRRADTALYAAKQGGRDQVVYLPPIL
ncbi:diguanylate cyclase, partial [Pseudomonas sp. SIMBA_059]